MTSDDPTIKDFRERISAHDRAIVDAVNARLELVAELKRYKDSRGIGFLDPERERLMIEELARANGGPLSDDGLRELVTEILALTKRELSRAEGS